MRLIIYNKASSKYSTVPCLEEQLRRPASGYSTASISSRIRRMQIPSKNSDVDKFLDEVFEQVGTYVAVSCNFGFKHLGLCFNSLYILGFATTRIRKK